MKKNIFKIAAAVVACISALTLCVGATNGVILSENFESGVLGAEWKAQGATKCFVTVNPGVGVQGSYALELNDGHDGTISPYYEGFAEAERIFTPQTGEMTVDFYFHSNKIPIGHELITLGMGETVAFEMLLNNHGQNSHIRLNNAGEYELVNTISANIWHRAKIKLNVAKNYCEFYLDDMAECKIKMKLTNPVEYIDRIRFETGQDLGESSVFRIDNLVITGTKKAVKSIEAADSIEVGKGAYKSLNAKSVPYDATDKTITYASKNAKIATVDKDGSVYGVSEGTTDITMSAGGATKVCKVSVVKNTVAKSDVLFTYDHDVHKLMLDGTAQNGEDSIVSVSIKEGENLIYFGQCKTNKNGKFTFALPYTVKKSEKIDLTAKFSTGETVNKSVSVSPDVKQSEIAFEKEVYVSKINQADDVKVKVETKSGERPNIRYTFSAKKTYAYGEFGYAGSYYVGVPEMNETSDGCVTDNAAEGEYFISASTVEDAAATAKVLVQVNEENAAIEDTASDESRTVKVSLPAKYVAENIKNGKVIRLAAGYAEITPSLSALTKEAISFTVVKDNTPSADVLAEYQISVSDNIKDVMNVIKFPMDYLASKISNYNLVSVYGSDDGQSWRNLKADVESGTNYMVIKNDVIYPYIQIKLNADKDLNHFAKNDVYSLYSKGIYTEDQVSAPDSYVTSAELAHTLKNAFFESKPISGGKDFITREKAAAAIYDAFGFKAQNANSTSKLAGFKDGGSVDASCKTALNTLCEYKIFNGDENSKINPKSNITVGELAIIVSRLKK